MYGDHFVRGVHVFAHARPTRANLFRCAIHHTCNSLFSMSAKAFPNYKIMEN